MTWSLSTDEVFHLFIRGRGRSPAGFESWLAELLPREVIDDPG